MTDINELQTLLDALVEEAITPDQTRRLEELVLNNPEAEAHYVRFMGFYAALIENVAGLPAPTLVEKPAPVPEPIAPITTTAPPVKEKPMKAKFSRRWAIAAALLVGLVGLSAYAGVQYAGWRSQKNEVAARQADVNERQADLARVTAEQKAAREAALQQIEPTRAAVEKVRTEYQTALDSSRKAIESKDFMVRLTGPTQIEPGAPNKWQIETLRRGAVARPKRVEIAVKDAKDAELFRQVDEKPVGIFTLELAAGFWANVKPGSDLFLEVVAFTDDDRRNVLADRLPLARPVYVTHLATDKPLYKPGETIRFRSLTLDRTTLKPPSHDLHLRFRLRDPSDAVVPIDEGNGRLLRGMEPLLGPDQQPLRGIGVGEHTLGSDAPGGEYKLDLFEVVEGKELLLETRKFIVNKYVPDTFEKKLEFDGKSYGAGDVVQARIEVSRTAGGPMKNATANVVASVDGKSFHTQGGEKFAIVTDATGTRAVLNVRFKLPADLFDTMKKDVPPNAVLSVNILDGSDAENILRPIPLVAKNLSVEFFPEGGEMVDGLPGRVYFQVRTPAGKPADLKGYITDGTAKLAEIATVTDAEHEGMNRGHGVFTLTPKAGENYFLKLTSPSGIIQPTMGGFPLPTVKADGIAITALDAVTPKGAPIRVRVQSSKGPKLLHVGAYARGKLISHQKLEVEAGKPVDLALIGDDLTGGVTRITVFEEVKKFGDGRVALLPKAERLVYRVPAEQLVLNVTPDKLRYSPGGKVRLDLAATDEKNAPLPAVLFVGVTNRSVISMADNKTDRLLPTHFLLAGEVKHPAELEHADFLLTDHPKAAVALDLLLATQGWRRFVEQTGTAINPADKPDVEKLLTAHGRQPSAPLELFKLEEQRVSAMFRPRLDQAIITRSAAEVTLNDLMSPAPSTFVPRFADARVAISVAEQHRREAAVELDRYESRFEKMRSTLGPSLLIAICVFGIYVFFRCVIAETATKPAGRGRPLIAGGAALAVCGLLFLMFANPGYKSSNESFSFVGSAIRPRGDAAPRDLRNDDVGLDNNLVAAAEIERAKIDLRGAVRRPDNMPMMPPGPGPGPNFGPRPAGPGMPGPGPGMPGPAQPGNADPKTNPAEPMDASFAALKKRSTPFIGSSGGKRPQVLNATVMSADGRIVKWDGGVTGDVFHDPIAHPGQFVLPFVVREYAHQRDPALGDVRNDFTETVYWHPVLVLPQSGKASVEFQLSDEIARYQIVVAGHTTDGRIGAITQTIEARKPFSVDPKLPLEISHTDTIDVPVRITNDSDNRRSVALDVKAQGLKFDSKPLDPFDLGPNGKGRRILRMTPSVLQGDATVLVTGSSKGADNDAIARTIGIVPDGFPGVGSFSDTIEGRTRGSVKLPKDIVPGTLKVRLEVYPTSMADLVKGLDGLLHEPGGCFEQTSTTNYPNTLIVEYINETNQANPELSKRAHGFLDRGYARLTSYECPDTPGKVKHGFEWFGSADMQHEALTAYGLLQFKDMARVHPVDPELIRRTQAFLMSRKDGQGGFKQNARALHSWGASKQVVNAYIVWALVESDPDDAEKLDLKAEIATLKAEALNADSIGGKDAYFVALVANVLIRRGEREAAHRLLDRLQEKHFKDGRVTGAVTSVTNSGGRDLEIETTALTLLGWLRANDPKYGMCSKEATKWISQQRGGYGGFGSTQSTVLALKALILHAKKNAHPPEAGEFQVLVGGKIVGTRKFTTEDIEVIGLDIPNPEAVFKPGERTEVEITITGKHAYPFALAYTYTTLTPLSAPECAVKIETKLGRNAASEGETVPLAINFENKQKQGHGMAVAIIGIPAGMKVPTDMKQLTSLREQEQISYFEIRGRELVLYWRALAPEQKIALTVDLVCEVPGSYRGPASRGYLYYNADHKHWVEPLSIQIAPAN